MDVNTNIALAIIETNECTFQYINGKQETLKGLSEIIVFTGYIKLEMNNGVIVYINKDQIKSLSYIDFADAE